MKRSLRSLNIKRDDLDLSEAGFLDGKLEVKLDQFSLVFELSGEEISVKAIDNDFGDEYIPFNVENSHGETTLFLRGEAEKVFARIEKTLGSKSLTGRDIVQHIKDTYFIDPVNPFQDVPNAEVFKNEYGKWFVLYMKVSAKHFYKDRDDEVEIINVKLPPKMVQETISKGIAHTCYHMNKKYWVSIILGEVSLEEVSPLILQSYIESGAKGYVR